ncbi:unnamed protein product [Cylicocyclus nassatus]|uniref:Uncharacterized protein n=1 Tax=Cylicocyclus nassatus TaxID=53992 RepID=A0AA36H926_CYLNA|nr:unnamed protein product [Cylicocyclus nassatus]
MFTFGNQNAAARDAVRQAKLAAPEAAREAVRNASTPTWEDAVRQAAPSVPFPEWAAATVFAQWQSLFLEDALILPQQILQNSKMFTFGNNSAASHEAERQAELAAREAAREVVRNSSTPTLEELVRSISPFSPECFGEDVEASSPPSSGRASVDSVALYNATVRAELHATQSLDRIQQLEGELSVARRQVDALQWSRGLHINELKETQALCKQHERNLTRMVRDLRAVHNVLPKALETHRAKLRALHPEEEEELLHHFLQKGNVVETFIEIITHGEGMILPQQTSKHRKMFTSGTSSAASHDAERQTELAARDAAREVPECFGEDVEDFSPPSSGRASVDSLALYNATVRADLHANQLKETQALCKQHERDLRSVHEVLPKALEAHRAKLRALHPEEEEELLHHFLQREHGGDLHRDYHAWRSPYEVGPEKEVQPPPPGQAMARGPSLGAGAHGRLTHGEPQCFGEGVEDFSPPASGSATARAQSHATQSLEKIQQLEGELSVARRQVHANGAGACTATN